MVIIPEGLTLNQAADFYADERCEEHCKRIREEYEAKKKSDPVNADYYRQVRDNDIEGAKSLVPVYRLCYLKRHGALLGS